MRLTQWTCLSWLVAFLAGGTSALAADIQFQAAVDRTRTGQADPIRLDLTITAAGRLSNTSLPQLDVKDFTVDGPARSDRTQIVNFETTVTRTFSYNLTPKRTGTLVIGPAKLTYRGKVYRTKPIAIEVTPGSPRLPGLEKHLYVRSRPDRQSLYVGQQLTLDYELYFNTRLHNIGFKDIPAFAGFWVEDLFVAQELQTRREIVDGVEFNIAPLRRAALFPTASGKQQIEPLSISCEIPRSGRRGGMFDGMFFGGSGQSVVVRSTALEIEVLPLPEAGRPAGFSGAVGQFAMAAVAQPQEVAVGDPVTLKVQIAGRGHLAQLKAPAIDQLGAFKVYDPKMEEQVRVENGRYGGSRTFEYILIPQEGGVLEIPPLQLAYFDPETASYKIARSEAQSIVARGELAEADGQASLRRKDILEMGQDIRHIKPDLQSLDSGHALHDSALFWGGQLLLPLGFVSLLLYQRHRQRLEGDQAYARRRRSRGQASKRLATAQDLLNQEESAAFHAEVQRAVTQFIADRFNVSAAGLSAASLAADLGSMGMAEETIEQLVDLLERCDFARFAPTASTGAEMEAVHGQAVRLIAQLEKNI
ncbi:MAG: hypothetical protein GKR89_00700 [Candidatus Latescibacteria bacterium]|nr:hypothetical protein [Candidatus Latescibacterota bacterium]